MSYTAAYRPPLSTEEKPPEIRIFISSTFRDMQAEREYLIKHIFPELRALCRERGVEFTEIDLRWGVTEEEAQQGKVVKICLDEIDRCRPYFIGILGDRYGWIPTIDDVGKDKELLEEFTWIHSAIEENTSVTEMEIVYGVLDNPMYAQHSYFYMRSPMTDDEHRESDPFSRRKQDALKDRIRQSGFPVRENYLSPEELGSLVRADLLRVIEQQFPLAETPSPLEQERRLHHSYAFTRRQAYIPNRSYIERINAFARSQSQPLIITGASGLGKSSLVAFWVNEYRKQHPDAFIIEHYVGAGSISYGHIGIIQRIMEEIKERFGLDDELPETPDAVEKEFSNWLAKIQKEQLILAIDGLDRLPDESRHLRWLPKYFPPMVSAIFSVDIDDTLTVLQQKGFETLEIQPLGATECEELIQKYLGQFRKSLSQSQRHKIISDPKTRNPLFLRTVLEELRIFGSFEELTERINHFVSAADTSDLFQRVLARMENDFGADRLTNILSLLWASRNGLSETEILAISGLTRLELSTILQALEFQLMRQNGLMNFFHRYLRDAVSTRYFQPDPETASREKRLRIADYFAAQEISERVASELPWQLWKTNEFDRLAKCISEIPMFIEFASEDKHFELLGYWRSIGDLSLMENAYTTEAELFFQNFPDPIEEASTFEKLGAFLVRSGRYIAAEPILRKSLGLYELAFGADSLPAADCNFTLGRLLHFKGEFEETKQRYMNVLRIRQQFLGSDNPLTARTMFHLARLDQETGDYQNAESLYRKALELLLYTVGKEHPETAHTMNNLALLLREKAVYDESESLLNETIAVWTQLFGKDHPNTAITIYNLAHLEDIKGDKVKAEELFRRSLAIWEKVYGTEHPTTAMGLDSLAILLRGIQKYDDALALYNQALEIWIKLLGEDHPNTATTFNNLGEVLMDMDRFGESEEAYARSRKIFEQIVGADHYYTSHPIHGMGLVNRKKGDFTRAAEFFKLAFDIRLAKIGKHPDTLEALNDYLSVLDPKVDGNIIQELEVLRSDMQSQFAVNAV